MKIVIIGAGPCGLGAAQRLTELDHGHWTLFEREEAAGGLAASRRDPQGFTWDFGGHVVFSHFPEFDRMLEETCGGELVPLQRRSYVKVGDSWVPYPFQNNLHRLPEDQALDAVAGLKSRPGGHPSLPFDRWLEATFGAGITRLFMRPYNEKVWATDLALMASSWVGERVSIISYEDAQKRLALKTDDFDWGPNSAFRYPLRGGTGEIFRRQAALLPQDRLHYRADVAWVDLAAKTVGFENGTAARYDRLITTMPLIELVRRCFNLPEDIRRSAERLRHSGVYVSGCGFQAAVSGEWTWTYFPEPKIPFYRATNFGRYSRFNVPDGRTDRYCAYVCETSFSDTKPEFQDIITQATWTSLYDIGWVSPSAPKASEFAVRLPYAYPVPTLDRDEALRSIQSYLMAHDVYSRGRFGAWLYELGNMDHAFKQGRDVVDFILQGRKESVWSMT